MTFRELEEKMYDLHDNGQVATAEIVYSASNWEDEYPAGERTYRTTNTSWGWDRSKMGHCRIGFALEGPDRIGIRLDWYDWEVESCRLVEVEPASFVTGGEA